MTASLRHRHSALSQSLFRHAACWATACLIAACAPPRATLPSGPGAPFAGFAGAYAEATAACQAVTTITASMALSGRAGRAKLRGRIDAGLAAPAQVRLEGFPPVAFGGKPYFTLVARDGEATLLWNDRVLRGATPAAILEALAGLPLGPSELQAVLTGCGLAAGAPSAGRSYDKGWAAVDVAGATTFLRQLTGRWQVAASARGSISVEYADVSSGAPQTVRVRSTPAQGRAAADITLRLSQIELNVPLERTVFDVQVPRDAAPITLDELRRAVGGGP